MYYISAQPDNLYFYWQLAVQINNFRKHKIENDMIILIAFDEVNGISKEMEALSKSSKAKFYFYPDHRTQEQKKYIPTIRPFLLNKFFLENEKLFYKKAWMYHDCDIIFRELPKFKNINNSNKIYLSDTRSYLDSNYIKGKSPLLFKEMCNIVGIDPKLVSENDSNAGGAQYVFGGQAIVGAFFWSKVLNDCVKLYEHMNSTINEYSPEHPIQSWTADMWAIAWNFWLMGYNVEISRELNFAWPVHGLHDWENNKILHNAGVLSDDKHLFFKGNYITKTPFEESFDYIDKTYCTYKYVEEIQETKKSLIHFS
jgi:hypothetical protein